MWPLRGAQGLLRELRPAGPLKVVASGSEEDAHLLLLASAGTFPKVIYRAPTLWQGFPSDSVVENSPAVQELRRHRFDPWVTKTPWRST